MNQPVHPAQFSPRRFASVSLPTITLAHGGGGKAMKDLIDDIFARVFDNPLLAPMEDQARLDLGRIAAQGDRLAFTTDSYVVTPLEFPGGDIGKLAVCGTVNDLAARGDLALETTLASDCAALHGLIEDLLAAAPHTRFIRDATRGGIATVLNELAMASAVAIEIDETRTPLRDEVRGLCEILGLDPLYLANEGKIVTAVPAEESQAALAALRAHPLGRDATDIGQVIAGEAGRVTMKTVFGGGRIVDMLVGEQLPRIC